MGGACWSVEGGFDAAPFDSVRLGVVDMVAYLTDPLVLRWRRTSFVVYLSWVSRYLIAMRVK